MDMKNLRFLTNISLYIINCTRQSYTYSDRPIGNRRLLWSTNGAIFSDLERSQTHISRGIFTLNITETAKDTPSCYKIRIGNRTQALEWYRFI